MQKTIVPVQLLTFYGCAHNAAKYSMKKTSPFRQKLQKISFVM